MSRLQKYALSPQLMMPWHPGRTVSAKQAADMLGCSTRTVLRMIEDGTLEAFKMRKQKPNSPYKVIRDSVIRASHEWREDAGVQAPLQSAPPATSPSRKPAVTR